MFPYERNRDELEVKTWVAGILVDGLAKANHEDWLHHRFGLL